VTGRFTTYDVTPPDYARPQSVNSFAYVEGNPVNFVDPSGHIKENEAAYANATIGNLKNYEVEIVPDFGYLNIQVPYQYGPTTIYVEKWKCAQAWNEGAWSKDELTWIGDAVADASNFMHGPDKFKSAMHGPVKVSRWAIPKDPVLTINGQEVVGPIRGFAPPSRLPLGDVVLPDYFFSNTDEYAKYSFVHELGHVWDRRTGLQLSGDMSRSLGTQQCQMTGHGVSCIFNIDVGKEKPPGYKPPYGPYAGGSAMEDWAEAFASSVYPGHYGGVGATTLGPLRRQYVLDQIAALP
jgi:hypothetical protein